MRLKARLYPFGDGAASLLTRLVPPDQLVFESARCAIDLDDDLLPRLLKAGENAGGFWISGESVLTGTELDALSHFEPVCRCVIKETQQDFAANDAARKASPAIDTGAESPIRILSGVSLSRIPLKPNMVGSVGDWTAEYVVGPAVSDWLRSQRFSGVTLSPVTNTRTGRPHENYLQLVTESIMGLAAIDDSVERLRSEVAEEDGRHRHLGCLSYERQSLESARDFNRTAEPWASWHGWPSWVVSARVRRDFAEAKLRGWHFRPVLATDTDLYAEYADNWRRLRHLVASTRASRMDGGRW